MPNLGFNGLAVLSLESRRAAEMAKLIVNQGGRPILAPAMREVALENHGEVDAFLGRLCRGELDLAVFLTGVGLRRMLEMAGAEFSPGVVAAALRRIRVVARGPKPVAELRKLGVEPGFMAPEPNTWREILSVLDAAISDWNRLRVGVQEYGQPAEELLEELRRRGAQVHILRLYAYGLPEDREPLRAAIRELAEGKISVVLFTSSQQAVHLLQVADAMQAGEPLRHALAQCVIASIGPTTSQTLRSLGLAPDLEPDHPHMGFLVHAAAERAQEILRIKRTA